MDIQEIANWVGWPIVAVALIILQWFYIQQVKLLKEKNDFLQEKLTNCEQNAPDVLAKRLAERYKLLSEELEMLQSEKEHSVQKVENLEQELGRTRQEAASLRSELANVQDVLWSIEPLPRDRRVRIDVAGSLLSLSAERTSVYLVVRIWGNPPDPMMVMSPYCMGVIYPGMHKTYLVIADRNGNVVGMVENHYGNLVYDGDFCETVKAILELAGMKSCPSLIDEADSAYLLEGSILIPLDDTLFLLKVPFELSSNEIMETLEMKYGEVG